MASTYFRTSCSVTLFEDLSSAGVSKDLGGSTVINLVYKSGTLETLYTNPVTANDFLDAFAAYLDQENS